MEYFLTDTVNKKSTNQLIYRTPFLKRRVDFQQSGIVLGKNFRTLLRLLSALQCKTISTWKTMIYEKLQVYGIMRVK